MIMSMATLPGGLVISRVLVIPWVITGNIKCTGNTKGNNTGNNKSIVHHEESVTHIGKQCQWALNTIGVLALKTIMDQDRTASEVLRTIHEHYCMFFGSRINSCNDISKKNKLSRSEVV
jgi:hypothetical protein